jgi:hypothetical protein
MRARTFLVISLTCVTSCGREARLPLAPLAPVAASLDRSEAAEGFDNRPVSTNFETFAVGAIDGQFDWKSLGGAGAAPPANPLDTHCAVYDHVIDDNAATGALYRYAGFGRHSLRISNATTSGCYSDQTFSSRQIRPGSSARRRGARTDSSTTRCRAGPSETASMRSGPLRQPFRTRSKWDCRWSQVRRAVMTTG